MQGSCSQYAQRQLRSSGKVIELNDADRRTLSQHQRKIADARCQQYDQTPKQKSAYRSMGRISKLLQTQEKCKNEYDVYHLLKKGAGRGQNRHQSNKEKSQCSSATTAFTIVQFANKGIVTRGRKQHQDEINNNKVVGKKRTARRPIEYLETETRGQSQMSKSQATYIDMYTPLKQQNFSCQEFGDSFVQQFQNENDIQKSEIPERVAKKFTIVRLRNKTTGGREEYRRYEEVDLNFLRAKLNNNKLILDFNMDKLELEYDYDTDEDQLRAAKDMLMHENISAVEFIIKEDPILLVGNLCLQN